MKARRCGCVICGRDEDLLPRYATPTCQEAAKERISRAWERVSRLDPKPDLPYRLYGMEYVSATG